MMGKTTGANCQDGRHQREIVNWRLKNTCVFEHNRENCDSLLSILKKKVWKILTVIHIFRCSKNKPHCSCWEKFYFSKKVGVWRVEPSKTSLILLMEHTNYATCPHSHQRHPVCQSQRSTFNPLDVGWLLHNSIFFSSLRNIKIRSNFSSVSVSGC